MLRSLRRPAALAATALALAGCRSAPAATAPNVSRATDPTRYEPARALGDLFADVQRARVFPDCKTFVDARPVEDPADIAALCAAARAAPGFDLAAFVARHFEAPRRGGRGRAHRHGGRRWRSTSARSGRCSRAPADDPDARSSLLPLPNPYVVPGGRFREVYYWDSYFTMLGLVESGRTDLVRNMLDNFAHLVAHRRARPERQPHLLPRPQPAALLRGDGGAVRDRDRHGAGAPLPRRARGRARLLDGGRAIASRPGSAHRRVVRLRRRRAAQPLLGRHPGAAPRVVPRGRRARADASRRREREALYRNLRAAAESGWDFSSRWMRDPARPAHARDDATSRPVDLNSLLYHAERTIAALRRFRARRATRAVAARASRPRRTRGARAARARRTIARRGLLLRRALAHGRARDGPARRSRRPRRSTSGSRRRSRGARSPRDSERDFLAAGRLRHDARSPRGSSGTRRTAGRRCSGSRSRARAATAAPTSPTRRAAAGSRSTAAPTRRRGR